jgi:acetolactate synthase-1/2/3 large subunit
MIAITGPVADASLARALGSVAKASLEVTAESAAHWIAHAGHLALTDPRGPVHLALDARLADAAAMPLAAAVRPHPLAAPTPADLDGAAAAIEGSARPVIIAGVQVRSSVDAEWLRAFAEARPAPVITTVRARGALPEPHPLSLGVLDGNSVVAEGNAVVPEGNAVVPEVLQRADLVIALGLDVADRLALVPPSTAVLHLGRTDRSAHSYAAAVQVIGDIALILDELAPRLRDRRRADWDVAELDRFKRQLVAERGAAGVGTIHELVGRAREATPAGAIAAFDRGVLAAAARWQCVSTLDLVLAQAPNLDGFALPAALAARLAYPDRPVIGFTDFGGLAASIAEFATATELGLDVVIVVGNETEVPLASIAGRVGLRTFDTDARRATAALARALDIRGPSLIDVRL